MVDSTYLPYSVSVGIKHKKKENIKCDCKDGLALNITVLSSRVTGFHSQNPYGSSHQSATTVLWVPMHFSGLLGH